MKKALGLLIIGAAAAYYISARAFAKGLKIAFYSASFDRSKSGNDFYKFLHFKIKLKIINPTDFSGKIDSLKANIYSGKAIVAYVDSSKTVEIKKKDFTVIELPVSIPTAQIYPTLANAWRDIKSAGKIPFRIAGVIKAPIGSYQFDIKKEISVW